MVCSLYSIEVRHVLQEYIKRYHYEHSPIAGAYVVSFCLELANMVCLL